MLSDVEEVIEPVASTSYLPPIQSNQSTITTTNSPNKTTLERVLSPNKLNSLNKSNKSLSNGNSSNTNSSLGGTRLLWRGNLILENKKVLNGLAIVAHLFTVPTVSPLQTIPQQPSPFDDPFSSNSNSNSSFSSAADLCLGLEMMRGGNIKVVGEIKVKLKGKENQSREEEVIINEEGEECLIEVETPSDVRVYIDKRCPETVDWFESIYCKNKMNKIGIKLDVGGEEVIIFPSYPDLNTAIDSVPGSRPTLNLLLGRRAQLKIRKPRPDDPMPRENLFANILRRTNSMPVLDFQPKRAPLSRSTSTKSHLLPSHLAGNSEQSQPKLSSKPSKAARRNSKSQSLVNLLNGEKEKDSTSKIGKTLSKSSSRDKISSTTTSTSSLIKKPRAPLSRSGSTRDLFSTSTNQHHHLPPQPPQLSARQTLKRSRTVSDLLLSNNSKRTRNFITDDEEMFSNNSSEEEEDDETILGGKQNKRKYGIIQDDEEDEVDNDEGGFVPGSPTPSIATTFGGEEEEFESETTTSKLFLSSTSIGAGGGKRGSSIEPRIGGSGRSKMQRSYSVPVGVVSMREESIVPIGGEAIEVRNRATVRKIVLARLTLAGVARDDERFKDIFSITSKGVQFALRTNYKSQLINKELATNFTDAHLSMYLGHSVTTSPPSVDIKSIVKQEEGGEESISRMKEMRRSKIVIDEKDLPPSPKSVEE